jgi:hypothetical protein
MRTAIKKTATKMKVGGAKKTITAKKTTAKKMAVGGMTSATSTMDKGKKKKKSSKGMETIYGKDFKRKVCKSWSH